MRLSCTITVKEESDIVEQVFAAEDKEFKHGRSGYSLARDGSQVIITAHAQDATALRATVTSITRILTIVEKTRGA